MGEGLVKGTQTGQGKTIGEVGQRVIRESRLGLGKNIKEGRLGSVKRIGELKKSISHVENVDEEN